ncbi:hypothetical protein EJB05_47176 [Eragrostis curvula]|uniref:Transposase (putative) gypsy type domain-containing protein n=1 Tax=Eragrostis curvula TaxID=38414 RepID=A0A5J9T797_9POAL|nr:hypothetical protein EJB05_47176 [Eragrostis curvula]
MAASSEGNNATLAYFDDRGDAGRGGATACARGAAARAWPCLTESSTDFKTILAPPLDVGADFSWPVAEMTTSTLRDPMQLQQLCDLCGVPKEYKPILAGPRVACTAPPEGSICVYMDALRTGSMRLPLHKFYMAVLQHYGLAPSQLVPNAWRYVAAFILLCKDAGVEPQLPVFKNFFYVRAHKGDSLGWHSFRAYAASGSVPLFTGQFRDRDHGWKARFFFLQAPSTVPWPFPVKWGQPRREAIRKPAVTTEATKADINKLLARVGGNSLDVVAFLAGRDLPLGRQPNLAATVKLEPPAGAALVESCRKRKSPEPSRGQTMLLRPAAPVGVCGVDHSATRGLFQIAEKCAGEIQEKEQQELQATKDEVARLVEELRQAKLKHAADITRLSDEHDADITRLIHKHSASMDQLGEKIWQQAREMHEADIARLSEEHAAKLQAVKVQCQNDLISFKHQDAVRWNEAYDTGLRDMMNLAVTVYPGVIKPSELKQELLSNSEFPPQAPASKD